MPILDEKDLVIMFVSGFGLTLLIFIGYWVIVYIYNLLDGCVLRGFIWDIEDWIKEKLK